MKLTLTKIGYSYRLSYTIQEKYDESHNPAEVSDISFSCDWWE